MKARPGDHRHRLLISGGELLELKEHIGWMAETFGLARKIEKYKGTRPITIFRWDLEALIEVIDLVLRKASRYAKPPSRASLALRRLGERLRKEHDRVYGREEEEQETAIRAEKASGAKTAKKNVRGASAETPNDVYQIKITLSHLRPPIWRRILVQDCSLDKLHEHIQTAMGWTNSHLHDFRIGEKRYADPGLMEEEFEELGYGGSTAIELSEVLPKSAGRFRFIYQYDFGDSWEHEVLFEKRLPAVAGQKYPVCLAGARACPPEDVGGIPGFCDFLDAIEDPDHEQHDELLEWAGPFDPEAFDPVRATKRMKKGLPDWRRMR